MKAKNSQKKRIETMDLRRENHNKTVLERYLERGFLELPQSPFSAEDRKKAGEMLAYDFYMGRELGLQAVRIRDINIPNTSHQFSDSVLFYRDRYLRAMRSIPHEFWPAVRRVCIEDKILKIDDENKESKLKNKNNVYFQKMLLNLGLERLIEFYLHKNKKSS